MEAYETGLLNQDQTNHFISLFDQQIGTEREINPDPDGDGRWYVVCYELVPSEVRRVRKLEAKVKGE